VEFVVNFNITNEEEANSLQLSQTNYLNGMCKKTCSLLAVPNIPQMIYMQSWPQAGTADNCTSVTRCDLAQFTLTVSRGTTSWFQWKTDKF
jgi:hypothetical protein